MTKNAMSTMKCAMTSLTPPRWRRRNALPRAFRVRRMKPRGFLPPESALSIRAASGFERAEPRRRMHSISTGNSNGGIEIECVGLELNRYFQRGVGKS